MDRKRVRNKPKPIQLGKKEMKYKEACEIAKYCDNLPPDIEKYINE